MGDEILIDWDELRNDGTEVMSRLDSLWKEMGLSDDERQRQVSSIVKQIGSIFASKLSDEEALKNEYVTLSEGLAIEIQELACETLKVEHLLKEMPESENVNLMRRLTWLRTEQEALHKIKEDRLSKVEPMQEELFNLWKLLGEEPEENFVDVGNEITEERIEEYQSYLNMVRLKKENRDDALTTVCADVCGLFGELEYEVTSEFDKEIQSFATRKDKTWKEKEKQHLGLSMDIIQQVSLRAKELTDEKISRTERLKQLGSQIQPLWDLLQVEPKERAEFFVKNTGLGLNVIKTCEDELERLQAMKQEKLEELVESAREKIKGLWHDMEYGESQKEVFSEYMNAAVLDDDLFDRHMDYVAELMEQNQLLQPILEKFTAYIELYNDREDYDRLIQDSSRLLSRKRGSLQEEEAQRKRVTIRLPKLVEKLKKDVDLYQEEHGPLLIQGKLCLDVLNEKENDYKERKRIERERKKTQRANKNTPHKTLPNKRVAPGASSRRAAKENTQNNSLNRSNLI